MVESPLVSICMPVYNGEKYLQEALNSVLAQTYKNLEVVVADNVSTDSTAGIVSSYNDERIKYFLNSEHVSMVENWNIAVEHATGKYIKMVHADDVITPDAVEKQVAAFEADSDVVICFSASEIINENSETVLTRRIFHRDRLLNGCAFAKRSLRGRNIYGEPTNIMYRREALAVVGEYDVSSPYCVDWDYNIRVSYLGKAFYYTEVLAKYRISTGSETSKLYRESFAGLMNDSIALIEKHRSLGKISLGGLDVAYFKIRTYVRMVMRIVFIKLQSIKNNRAVS